MKGCHAEPFGEWNIIVAGHDGVSLVQPQEVRSLADAAGEGTRVLTALVRDLHSGIAARIFKWIGPAAKPVELIHNTTAAATYYAVDHALRASLHGAGRLAAEVYGGDEDGTIDGGDTCAATLVPYRAARHRF